MIRHQGIDLTSAAQPPKVHGLPWVQQIQDIWSAPMTKQIVLYGNIDDIVLVKPSPLDSPEDPGETRLLDIEDYFWEELLAGWDWVIHLDSALGLTVRRGEVTPKEGLRGADDFFREIERLRVTAEAGKKSLIVLVSNASYMVGANDQVAALLTKRWALSHHLRFTAFSVVYLSSGILELHSTIRQTPQITRIELGYPTLPEIRELLELMTQKKGREIDAKQILQSAEILQGISLSSLYTLFAKEDQISLGKAEEIKKASVLANSDGMLEFMEEGAQGLDILYGQDDLKAIIRRDIKLWHDGHFNQMPKGYLMLGPVGVGKTFMVEAISGEAHIPVLKINNFRGAAGETESRLEKIFRQIHSLPRAYVFIDEADQMMGERKSGAADGGLSGRIYGMFAQEIARDSNRGRVVWIFATSQPQKLEPDLKRPGRVDLKIPLLPYESATSTWKMLRELGKRWKLNLDMPVVSAGDFGIKERLAKDERYILSVMPELMTPAAATAVLGDIYRTREENIEKGITKDDRQLLMDRLRDYTPPIPLLVMREQTRLACRECSDRRLIPKEFHFLIDVEKPYVEL